MLACAAAERRAGEKASPRARRRGSRRRCSGGRGSGRAWVDVPGAARHAQPGRLRRRDEQPRHGGRRPSRAEHVTEGGFDHFRPARRRLRRRLSETRQGRRRRDGGPASAPRRRAWRTHPRIRGRLSLRTPTRERGSVLPGTEGRASSAPTGARVYGGEEPALGGLAAETPERFYSTGSFAVSREREPAERGRSSTRLPSASSNPHSRQTRNPSCGVGNADLWLQRGQGSNSLSANQLRRSSSVKATNDRAKPHASQ